MFQTEEELTAIIYCTSGKVTKVNNNVIDVVVVVYVPGVNMSVLEGQMSYVPMCKWLVYAVYNWI